MSEITEIGLIITYEGKFFGLIDPDYHPVGWVDIKRAYLSTSHIEEYSYGYRDLTHCNYRRFGFPDLQELCRIGFPNDYEDIMKNAKLIKIKRTVSYKEIE